MLRHCARLPRHLATPFASRHASGSISLNALLDEQLESIREAGTFKSERVITSPQNAAIRVAGSDSDVLNFCANNYLGLSDSPVLVEAAKRVLDTHGLGLSSVRFICGTQDIHKRLEAAIAEFHGLEDAILYPSCFDANAGLFEGILAPEDAIISDELNHASIIDGIRLCKADRHRYKHLDMADLEAKLQATQGARTRLVATDGVFSMDGDIAPLSEICDLADKWVWGGSREETGVGGGGGGIRASLALARGLTCAPAAQVQRGCVH